MIILPSLKVERQAAVRVLRDLLRSGTELIATDPISEVRRGYDKEGQVHAACDEMRRKTRDWVREATGKVNANFAAPVVSEWDLINPTHLYPRLSKMREILHSIEDTVKDATTPTSPHLMDDLHPKILKRQASYKAGQFDDAIFNAMKTIEHEIRLRISGRPEDVGVQLVSKAMNPKDPVLVFSGVMAEQEAAHSLFRGAIGVFKNPLSHRFLDMSDQTRAWETLGFASLLMRMLDDAKDQALPEGVEG